MKKKRGCPPSISFFVIIHFCCGRISLSVVCYFVSFPLFVSNSLFSVCFLLHIKTSSSIIMAFTKAFYEQAFERNLKAQTTTTTTRQHADTTTTTVVPTMTHTQRATTTAMFTAHSKKEVVRQIYIAFFFVCVRIYMRELFVEIWGARERSDGWFPRRARETSEEVVFTRRGNDLDARATSRDALCAR